MDGSTSRQQPASPTERQARWSRPILPGAHRPACGHLGGREDQGWVREGER